MTKIEFVLLTVGLLCLAFVRGARAEAAPSPAQVREMLHQCVEKQNRAPGIVVGLVDKDGPTIIAAGKFDNGQSMEVNGDTIFEIGSVTKVFTSLILQDMADHGELNLDDPITNFLPASVKVPSRNGKQITLRSLATHSSGLPRLPSNLSPKDEENPYADYTVEQMYHFLSTYKLKRDVGAKSEYSNFGMGLLGHLLALRAGTDYESLIVNRICRPLDMESTRITLTPELAARLAPGHNEAGARVSNWDLPTLAGCGALRSSANDLLKFVSAQMGLTNSPLLSAMQKTQAPQKTNGFLSKIGLAWQIDKRVIWHNGGTGGYRSYIGFKKDKSLGVVVLCNSANDIDDIGQYLLGARAEIDDTEKRRAAKIDYSIYDRYVGQYQCSWSQEAYFTITRDHDRLMAQLTGQQALEIFPESKSEFFYTTVDAQITFVPNENGAVTHLVLHQNGADLEAKKLDHPVVLKNKEHIEAKINRQIYDRYLGKYRIGQNDDAVFTVTREENQLFVQLTGQEPIEIFPESETDFFCKVVDAQITFGTNQAGKATYLTLHQGGFDQKAKKFQ